MHNVSGTTSGDAVGKCLGILRTRSVIIASKYTNVNFKSLLQKYRCGIVSLLFYSIFLLFRDKIYN